MGELTAPLNDDGDLLQGVVLGFEARFQLGFESLLAHFGRKNRLEPS